MKKILTIPSVLIIMGACSVLPPRQLEKEIDPHSSEGKAFIEKFNRKKYYATDNRGNTVSDDLLYFNDNGELFRGSTSCNETLYSAYNDRFIVKSIPISDPTIYYYGKIMRNTQLIHPGVKTYEIAQPYTIDNINWDSTIGPNETDSHLAGETK